VHAELKGSLPSVPSCILSTGLLVTAAALSNRRQDALIRPHRKQILSRAVQSVEAPA
jgi:hypothetical protein